MMNEKEISILLSTYNGEAYLPDFLESLKNQTYKNWHLFVRDDGSRDNTIEIIKSFKKAYPSKISIIEDNLGNLGACKSFLNLLMSLSEGQYFMFADQDDVWLPEKIEITLNKMKETEEKYNKPVPVLVHTDLVVVDKNLTPICNFFWKYQNQDPRKRSLNYLLVQNNITGCTVMINRTLKELVTEVPEKALMHDWWLALVASVFGVIEYVDKPTILYRQHEKQNTGAKKYSLSHFFNRFIKNKDYALNSVLGTLRQAEEFLRIYKNLLPEKKKRTVLSYIELFKTGKFKQLQIAMKYKFFKQGFIRNLGFIGVLMLIKEETSDV